MKKDPNKYPKGWNAGKVRRVLDHYENQSDADAAREIDRAARRMNSAWIEVPIALVPRCED